MALGGIQLGLRVWQFVWTLLVMALIGNLIAESYSGNPAIINYTMFVSAFSMFSLLYLFPASFNIDWAIHPILLIALDTLNMLLFFTCAIALAAQLECHSCSDREYILNNSVTNGSLDPEKRCREAQASTAFLWFAWAGYSASWILSILQSRRAGADLRPRVGPVRGGARPTMAQV